MGSGHLGEQVARPPLQGRCPCNQGGNLHTAPTSCHSLLLLLLLLYVLLLLLIVKLLLLGWVC